VKLFVALYNDAQLLGHFLRHYARAGIAQFFIALPPEWKGAAALFLDRYNITLCHGLDVEDSLLGGAAAVCEMRKRYQQEGEWVVIVDLDEFVEFPGGIRAVTAAADRVGANIVRGIMLDRFARDGQPAEFGPGAELGALYPIKSRFIRNVMGGCDYKGVLVKGPLKPAAGAGHHRFDDERTWGQILEISHYKWIPGALDRLQASHQRVAAAGIAWAREYRRALDHYERHGRFAWETFGGKPAREFRLEPPPLCTDCGGAISEDEFAFSLVRFGRGLCRTDQKEQHAKTLRADPPAQ
jgi:Glycosyl transferase family 2